MSVGWSVLSEKHAKLRSPVRTPTGVKHVRVENCSYKLMICKDGCIGAAGETVLINPHERMNKDFMSVLTKISRSSSWSPSRPNELCLTCLD